MRCILEDNNDNLKGYVRLDDEGNPIYSTFTTDSSYAGQIGWEYIEIPCGYTTTTSTTTSTSSSTTTTFTTPAPTTTSTTTTSTTTTTTTSTTTTTTSTTTTTTSSTTTTTTTLASFDGTFAVEFNGDVNMAGTLIIEANVNAQNFNFSPDLGDEDSVGEVINGAVSYTIRISFDRSGSASPGYVASHSIVTIRDSVNGTVYDTSLPGFTGTDELEFTTTALSSSVPIIQIGV